MLALIRSNSAVLPYFNNLKVNFQLWNLGPNLFLLKDSLALGNMLIYDAPNGLVIVDTKTEACYPTIYELLFTQFGKAINCVINTHCHPGHVSGNIGLCNGDLPVIAHYKTAERMLKVQNLAVLDETFQPMPASSQPNCTISGALKLNFVTESLTVTPLCGHTDGDLVVFYRETNAVHTGGLCSFGSFPYIGLNEGGSVDGMLAALRKLHGLLPDNTVVIPGHGEPGDRKRLADYIEKLQTARDNTLALIEKGAGLEDILSQGPSSVMAADCNYEIGPLNQAMFEVLLYQDLSRKL